MQLAALQFYEIKARSKVQEVLLAVKDILTHEWLLKNLQHFFQDTPVERHTFGSSCQVVIMCDTR